MRAILAKPSEITTLPSCIVVPAKAGTQDCRWMPAFTGVTKAGKGRGELVVDSARSALAKLAAGSVWLVGDKPSDPGAAVTADRCRHPGSSLFYVPAKCFR